MLGINKAKVLCKMMCFLLLGCNVEETKNPRVLSYEEIEVSNYFYDIGRDPLLGFIGATERIRYCISFGVENQSTCITLSKDITERASYVLSKQCLKEGNSLFERQSINYDKTIVVFNQMKSAFKMEKKLKVINKSKGAPLYSVSLELFTSKKEYWIVLFYSDYLTDFPRMINLYNEYLPSGIPELENIYDCGKRPSLIEE